MNETIQNLHKGFLLTKEYGNIFRKVIRMA